MDWIKDVVSPNVPWFVALAIVILFFIFRGTMLSMDLGHVGKVMITRTEDVQQSDKKVETHGNPDQFRLLFKAQSSTWVKSTKAMNVPGGCLVQMSTDRKQKNGSWVSAETSTFLPGTHVVPDENGKFTIEAVDRAKPLDKHNSEVRASVWMV